MGSSVYEYTETNPRNEIDSIIPAPAGMRAVMGSGKKAEEWPVACLALTATSEVRAVVLDDDSGMTNFADEMVNFSGFLYAGETLEDHIKGKAEVLAEEKAAEAKAKARKAKGCTYPPKAQITDATNVLKSAKAKGKTS